MDLKCIVVMHVDSWFIEGLDLVVLDDLGYRYFFGGASHKTGVSR